MAPVNASMDLPPRQEQESTKTGQSGQWEAATEEIEEEDDNMLIRLNWNHLQEEFLNYLEAETTTIETIVSQHLDLTVHQPCRVAERPQWLHGSYNVCIPVFISNWRAQRVLIRCPFPHRLGGLQKTALMEEKLRCEAASYAWISQNCPRVPIPHLWGFGLPGGLCFSPVARAPWYLRALVYLKQRWACVFHRPYFHPFVPHQSLISLKSGYLLIDFFEKERGQMLSTVWPPPQEHRQTLFRSLWRILLDLSRPLSKIGSFTVHDSGEVSLSNRPLTPELATLENVGIPTEIPQDHCYSSTDSYLLDLLHCHDQKLIHQPNAARGKNDLEGQMATIVILRALLPKIMDRRLRHGPFIFTLTDLHESNMLVDTQYRITGIMDLEWSCSLPIEMQHPPFWLNGDEFDDLYGEGTEEKEGRFESACEEVFKILEQEQSQPYSLPPGYYAQVMRDSLRMKKHWYVAAVNIPHAAYNLFVDCLQPQFAPAHLESDGAIKFQDVAAKYWSTDALNFTEQKARDWNHYLRQLRSRHEPAWIRPL